MAAFPGNIRKGPNSDGFPMELLIGAAIVELCAVFLFFFFYGEVFDQLETIFMWQEKKSLL